MSFFQKKKLCFVISLRIENIEKQTKKNLLFCLNLQIGETIMILKNIIETVMKMY